MTDLLTDPILRAQEAERILTSPITVESFDLMEQAIVDGWKAAPMRDAEGMAEMKRMHLTLQAFKAHFYSAINTGKIEMANRDRSLRERVGHLFRAA
jgi:hypothetical protein